MGASSSAYLISWIVFFLANGVLLSGIFVAILSAAGVFSSLSLGQIVQMFGLYFLLMFAIFSFCMMLAAFFSDSQLAAQVITFVQLLGVALYFLLKIESLRDSGFALGVLSLFPPVCF